MSNLLTRGSKPGYKIYDLHVAGTHFFMHEKHENMLKCVLKMLKMGKTMHYKLIKIGIKMKNLTPQ